MPVYYKPVNGPGEEAIRPSGRLALKFTRRPGMTTPNFRVQFPKYRSGSSGLALPDSVINGG